MEYLDFCINQVTENHSPITVDAIYYVFANKDYIVNHLKIPNSYVLVSTLSGSGTINIDNKSYTLNAGDVFIFDASKVNFNYFCKEISWNFWWFEFQIKQNDFIELPIGKVFTHPLNELQRYLCDEALCSLKLRDNKSASSLFVSLICLLQKQNSNEQNEIKGIETFKKADKYIRKNLSTATVKSTAEHLNISERTLLNVFRKQLNISTLNYINCLKTDMARHLLLTSEMSIQAIAETLGYPDQFVFSKSFKKQYGLSPRKYRAQQRQQN